MGITDPSEEYFKNGAWGWDGSEWRKLGLVWSYLETYYEYVYATGVGAGINYLTGTAVPAGEVWRVTNVYALNTVTAAAHVQIQVLSGGVWHVLDRSIWRTVSQELHWAGLVVLSEGEQMRVGVDNCVNLDNIYAYICGHKMGLT